MPGLASLAALLLVALATPSVAQARSIDPQAIDRAVAFWQPYSPTPVCPSGVDVQLYAPGQGPAINPYANGGAVRGIGCEINVSTAVAEHTVAVQCAIVAHELGHAVFGLPDSDDPANVMADIPGAYITIPAACAPRVVPRRRKGHLHRAHP